MNDFIKTLLNIRSLRAALRELPFEQLVEHSGEALRGNAVCGFVEQGFAVVVVCNVEDAYAASVIELVVHEVDG